jgi:hypothetical protein
MQAAGDGCKMSQSELMNISANISKFLGAGQRQPSGREASFDFCFNYFQSFRTKNNIEAIAATENIQLRCLHLGFYLASWGMLRNSPLQQRSIKHYQQLIENLVQFDRRIWDIDIPDYRDAAKVSLLLKFGSTVTTSLQHNSDTLKTKVMLGVFGNAPAFDQFFCPGLGVGSFCGKSLKKIVEFYEANRAEVNSYKIPTLDFLTGQPTRARKGVSTSVPNRRGELLETA